jgi:hypothetical protein
MWTTVSEKFRVDCTACQTAGVAVLGITRRGWPYVTCLACQFRGFYNSPGSLTTLRQRHPEVMMRLAGVVERSRAAPAGGELRGGAEPALATGS